jgi:hypothetical protein
MKNPTGNILRDEWTVQKKAKAFGIPWNTLKDRLETTPASVKVGRPFNVTATEELKIVS